MNIIDAQLNFLDTSLRFRREVSCFATSANGVISITTNDSAGMVEFDFFEIWERLKKNDPKATCAYMLHSHPKGMNYMSSIDKNMVYGWRLALGIPIYFYVVTDEGVTKYLCDRKENGNPEIELLLFDKYDDFDILPCIYLLSMVVYGLSVAPKVEQNELDNIQKELEKSSLRVLA